MENSIVNLREDLDVTLLRFYLDSDDLEWEKIDNTYKYYKDNISCNFSNFGAGWELSIHLHETGEQARTSKLFSVVYTFKYHLQWNWFSSLQTRKIYTKFERILKNHRDANELKMVKEAYKHLPNNLLRKVKLNKLG
jgi:hypothetical protein